MRDKNTITVYWAPASFSSDEESWNMLYRDPELLFSSISQTKGMGDMAKCPALKNFMKNTFVFKSNIADNFTMPDKDYLEQNAFTNSEDLFLPVDSKIGVKKKRKSSIPGYMNIEYNVSWIFFSDEPLVASFTPPYFPAISPVKDSFLAIGEYDIGQWFRPFNLDYHIPTNSESFSIREGDPFYFVNFKTDKKIVFKRFTYTNSLKNLAFEFIFSPSHYGKNKTLKSRYLTAKKSKINKIVLQEIKKNLVD